MVNRQTAPAQRTGGSTDTGPRRADVIGMLSEHHRMLDSMFTHLESWSGTTGPAVDERARAVIGLLVRGFVAEERHLHPAVRIHVEDGPALVEECLDDHDAAEVIMEVLEAIQSTHVDFWPLLTRLIHVVRQHFDEGYIQHLGALHIEGPVDELSRLSSDLSAEVEDRYPDWLGRVGNRVIP